MTVKIDTDQIDTGCPVKLFPLGYLLALLSASTHANRKSWDVFENFIYSAIYKLIFKILVPIM